MDEIGPHSMFEKQEWFVIRQHMWGLFLLHKLISNQIWKVGVMAIEYQEYLVPHSFGFSISLLFLSRYDNVSFLSMAINDSIVLKWVQSPLFKAPTP